MADKKVIWFVCAEDQYDLYNERSAVDAILNSILNRFTDRYEIYVNGLPFQENLTHTPENPLQSGGLISKLKRYIPTKIKERIKMKKLLKVSDDIIASIPDNLPKPDVIFELYKLGSKMGYELKKQYDCPLVLYYDSPVVEQYEDIRQMKMPYRDGFLQRETTTLQQADQVIVYSRAVKEYIEERGVKDDIYVFQTLDYNRLKISESGNNKNVIGFIGGFMHWHRVDLLVKAFSNLKPDFPDLKLYLIGKGECFDQIKALVGRLPYKKDVLMPGFVTEDRLIELKKDMTIGVMPGSNWYGMPTKVFDYGLAGIPAVVPDTPSIKDILEHGQTAHLFKWDDGDGLESALRILLRDEIYSKKLAENLRQDVIKNHTMENAERLYIEIFNKAISQNML